MTGSYEEDLQGCLAALRSGGIILYPTDTVWGLGCDATKSGAVQKIYELKQRAESKSLIALITEEGDIYRYVAAPDIAVFDFLQAQDRPTTIVFDGALGFAENLPAEDGSIALRLVREPFCRQLVKRLGKPLVSTSANISGEPTPLHFAHISPAIITGVDYVVRYRQEDTTPVQPSQIIRWTGNGPVTIRK